MPNSILSKSFILKRLIKKINSVIKPCASEGNHYYDSNRTFAWRNLANQPGQTFAIIKKY